MLTIRLQRTGKRNQADFRIVLAQKTAAAGKKFVEVLGHYNPRSKAFGIKDQARLQYWIAQHVELSPTLHNLLVSKNLLEGKKVKAFSIPKKPAEPAVSTPPVPATTADEPKAEDPKNEPVSGQAPAESLPDSTGQAQAESSTSSAEPVQTLTAASTEQAALPASGANQ